MSPRPLLALVIALAACKGRGVAVDPATATPAAPAPAARPRAARPTLAPSAIPDGLVAHASVGDPAALRDGLRSYAAAIGPQARAQLDGMVAHIAASGLDLARPLHALVFEHGGSFKILVAGAVADEVGLGQLAAGLGLAVSIDQGFAAIGDGEVLAHAAAHARWRAAQPTPAELRVVVDGRFLATMVERTLATEKTLLGPGAAMLGGFTELERIEGALRLAAGEATLTVAVLGEPDSGLARFAARQRPSDFALAPLVVRSEVPAVVVATLDMREGLAWTRELSGMPAGMWDEWLALAEGSFAAGGSWTARGLVVAGAIGLTDGDKGRALFEAYARTPPSKPPLVSTGRPRARRLGGDWVHEISLSVAPDAPAAMRAALEAMWGKPPLRQQSTVIGTLGIFAMGVGVAGQLDSVVARHRKPRPLSAAERAPFDEARGLGESALILVDAARLAAKGAATSGSPLRIGIGFGGSALTVRLTVPAGQAAALASSAAASKTADAAAVNQVVAGVSAFADRACACADAACAEKVQKDFMAFIGGHGDTDGSSSDRDRVERDAERMMTCLMAAQSAGGAATP